MSVRFCASAGNRLLLHRVDHRPHVAHGAVAQKRHRAVGDLAMGLDLGPPDAAMTQADPILVERFGDDHMLHALGAEPALLGQVGDAAEAPRFLVGGAADLDRAGEIGTDVA